MIIRARTVVTMDGPPLENGAVAVEGERIRAVGRWDDLRGTGGETLDLGEQILLPGLINAHCHLDYTMLRGRLARRPASFTDWIRNINAEKSALGPADYRAAIEEGLEGAAAYGTTTLCNLEAFPEVAAETAASAMRVWWFAEMIDVREPVSPEARLDSLSERFPHAGLAPHAPFTASAQLYAETTRLARERDLRWTTHLAESREEMAMFRDGRGALFEFMREIGRPMEDCGRQTPVALMFERGLLDERSLVVHLNELEEGDFELLEAGPRFPVVHCPRSHAWFGHAPFALERLRPLGFNVSLATDSLASNDDLSLFAEMRAAGQVWPALSPRELLEMVTINPARALGAGAVLGRLKVGFFADLVAIPARVANRDTFAGVLAHEGKVWWRMVGGRAVLAS